MECFYAWAKEQGLVSNDLEDKGFTNELVGDWYLTVKDVSFFGDKAVLNNVSLEVQKGEIVSILGPSGVGKSTLFNLIAGILPYKAL